MVARFGGDEFAILVPEADRTAAIHLAQKIKMSLASTQLHLPNDTQRYLSACIGIAVYPQEVGDAKALFNLADLRMYQAKRSSQGTIIFGEN
jgi:diguanylate cyclase (GGDEF)-like protein